MSPKAIDSLYLLLILLGYSIFEILRTPVVSDLDKTRQAEYLTYSLLFFIGISIPLFFVQRKRNFVAKQEIITVNSLEGIKEIIDPDKDKLKEINYSNPYDLLIPRRVIDAGRDQLEPDWPLTLSSLPFIIIAFFKKRYRYDSEMPSNDKALQLAYKSGVVKFIYYPLEYKDDGLWNYVNELESQGLKVIKPKTYNGKNFVKLIGKVTLVAIVLAIFLFTIISLVMN